MVDPFGDGHQPRVRTGPHLKDPAGDLLAAFQEGDPEKVYNAALVLIGDHKEALSEVASLRFRLNFGTAICDRCDGLRAGPDVAATCFDVKQCHYTSIKRGGEDPRHLHVLQNLLQRVPPK